jgi:alpha,alpha-trehalase
VEKLASKEDGRAMLKKYLLNPSEMKGKYGFRSLSAKDPDYNNKNIIVPFSNWQGPVWVNANCIDAIALHNYGLEDGINWMAGTVGNMLLRDLRKYGTMHESYDADTGKPLAPAQSYVDKDGNFVGFISWNLCLRSVMESLVSGQPYLLEIK